MANLPDIAFPLTGMSEHTASTSGPLSLFGLPGIKKAIAGHDFISKSSLELGANNGFDSFTLTRSENREYTATVRKKDSPEITKLFTISESELQDIVKEEGVSLTKRAKTNDTSHLTGADLVAALKAGSKEVGSVNIIIENSENSIEEKKEKDEPEKLKEEVEIAVLTTSTPKKDTKAEERESDVSLFLASLNLQALAIKEAGQKQIVPKSIDENNQRSV